MVLPDFFPPSVPLFFQNLDHKKHQIIGNPPNAASETSLFFRSVVARKCLFNVVGGKINEEGGEDL